ncbi:MAG: gliding motility-associated C-terminal domain-containing protein [Bacteroidales bacterium]
MKKHTSFFSLWILLLLSNMVNAQMNLTTTTQINTVCNGNPCTYNGPKIMINEVMLTPSVGDGSIYGQVTGVGSEGEWIELYNPDLCLSVDISCFFLGNNSKDQGTDGISSNYGGGFIIPNGTVVPPRGFVIIRGIKAPAVPSNLLIQNGGKTIEIVVNSSLSNHVCIGGGRRLWFPNNGGWFAFYDNNGVPQDAISWNTQTYSCLSCIPCIPSVSTCAFSGNLASYDSIPLQKKNYITSLNPGSFIGQSFRRIPDGGNWVSTPSIPTYGSCNALCIPPPNITCTGKATVFVSGGQPPYSFKWNDQQLTTTATVTGLCSGNYTVEVKDANSQIATTNVHIENLELNSSIHTTAIICKGGNNGNITLTLNNGESPFNYIWSNGDTTASINNLFAGNYSVTITDTNDCKTDTTVVLPDSPVIPFVSSNNPTICSGTTTLLTATPSLQGGSYKWLPGGQQTASISISPPVTSNYPIVYTIAGCIAKDTSVVTVKPSPHASVSVSSNTIFIGDSVIVTANGGLSYLWNNGFLSNSLIMYPVVDTFYCVFASNNNDCFDTACVNIKVKGVSTFYVPNSFTPNGDGINDLFLIAYTHIEKFHIYIFSRWGNLLFETNDINVGWDGKYLGDYVSEGVYVYSIEAIGEDGVNYRKLGSVTVLR